MSGPDAVIVTRLTAARWETLASVLARRTRASTSHTGSSSAASPVAPGRRRPRRVCTEPGCHQLHTSSVTNGQERGEQPLERRQGRGRARPSADAGRPLAPRRRRRGSSPARRSRRRTTRTPPRCARGRGRSRSPRTPWSPRRRGRRAGRAAPGRPARSPRRRATGCRSASTNLVTLSSLVASLRPIFIWPSSNGGVDTGPGVGGPVAHAVGAVLVEVLDRA